MKHHIQFPEKKIELEKKGNSIFINDQNLDFELLTKTSDSVSLLIKNKVFKIDLISRGEEEKTIKASINGKVVEFSIKTDLDLLLEKMGGGSSGAKSAQKIKAPMPGLIVKIIVQQGDSVEKGQVLLNFEAMKMENQLKSPGAGKIKSISVSEGDKIEKGQILVELE